ncbi:PHD-like zinc-binding domain-containing protein [Phthorimaea operculella]|nr:PHD-like zinc-binding domain-containing protein [Phthorimaea operculella]
MKNVNQEQPLLLEELLEQEKREQEREGGEWAGPSAAPPPALPAPAPAAPSIPLYAGVAPPAPPPPPERAVSEADHHARLVYEQWLKQYNAYATDQLRYYEGEVQKLRKIRKSLNSKQRQLRKSGNELLPADAAELQRVATEQQALQKHLEAARKQAKQHSMLIQEYETKHRPQNPQMAQQSVIGQQQITTNQTVFQHNQNLPQQQQQMQQSTISRPMQLGLQGAGMQQQQTLIRTQQVIGSDGQISQQRIGLVTSPLNAQGRILQQGRTLVIEQTGQQQQLVRQLSGGVQERPQSVGGMVQFGQQQMGVRTAMQTGAQTPRPTGQRPAMSPLHVQSPHSQSPLHSIAPQSPLHHLTSPMQSPLHSQQSPLHHTSQSPLHPSTQSPLHTQQSPLHSQQSPMHVQQTSLPQQSPMHPQQSPMHQQQSPMHQQQNQILQQSPMHPQQSPMHQQSSMHQSPHHGHQSQMQQQSPMHPQQSPMHSQQSPMHSQQSPMHMQQSPMHTQQSPMQSSMSPQHFLQQLQAQRTSPQLPTPSRSPQIYQQSQIQSPVASHSPQMQTDYGGRFPRPAPGCSPLPNRFARPPHPQQGMRVGVPFGSRQQTSPLGSPQPMPSPGNTNTNEMARQQMLQRQQYSPMNTAPASPVLARSPHVAASPAPPSAHHDHGGGGHHSHHMAPLPPPGYRYFKAGLFGGAPVWPNKDNEARRPSHINKVSILKRRTPPRPRFPGKTAAPTTSEERHTDEAETSGKYVLYSEGVDYSSPTDESRYKDDDDDVEEYVEHLDDDDIVVVEPGAISPEERIATEEDFEELIDGKPEEEAEEPAAPPAEKPTRTETTTKTVAVISLAPAKQQASNVQQYKISQNTTLSRLPMLSATVLNPHSNTKILNEVSQATVASVSIANQTISVPVLTSLSVPISGHAGSAKQIKKMPLNINNPPLSINMSSAPQFSKPISSVISVISSNVPKSSMNPVITLATSNTAGTSRVPVSILTQHQVKQKIVKTIEKPMALSLSNTKLSSLSVSHDVTLPAKIFQDDAASPDSTAAADAQQEKDNQSVLQQMSAQISSQMAQKSTPSIKDSKDIDIESEISKQTELPHSLCISDRTPLLLGKAEIKSPDPIPEKIPDNIMEGDDEDKPEDNVQSNPLMQYSKPPVPMPEPPPPNPPMAEAKEEQNVVQTIKAIANQTKEMVIGSNMQITSDMAHDSVQISIPSPTPSQERYLNDITMQEHHEAPECDPKHVESFEDMLSILENINDDGKAFALKQQQQKQNPNQNVSGPSGSNVQMKTDSKESQEPGAIPKRETERLGLQSATVPQLSPLSQPEQLTSNMANVSQQLRTIMSSLNTSAAKEPQNVQQMMRKTSDATTPTQVNFENLLPSSKVEVPASRPSPVQRIEKPPTPLSSSEPLPMSAAQMVGTRVNTLSAMGQMRKSPSPISSPVGTQNIMKSPAQSPLLTQQQFPQNEDIPTSMPTQQIIQMPALSKIHSSASQTIIHSNNTMTTVSGYQKGQPINTSILGHTLLQPTRQMNTSNQAFSQQSISSSQPPALVMSRPMMGNKEPSPNVTIRSQTVVTPGISQMQTKPTGNINFITGSKLLHTQLTSPLKRSKSTDEPKSEIIVGHIQPAKRHSVEAVTVKSEPMETDEPNSTAANADAANKGAQQNLAGQRHDESQNVLLKQLLQTSTTTTTHTVPQRTMTITRNAPPLGSIPSLEAQLARPSIPPPTLALTQEVEIPKNSPRQNTSVNSPFAQRPMHTTSIPTSSMSPSIQTSTQSLMDVRKQPPMKMIPKEETTPLPESSPTIPRQMQMYPMHMDPNQQLQQQVKKEVPPPMQSPVHRPFTPLDVKKELLDESSQQSATSGISTASDQGKLDVPMKEEFPENASLDPSSEVNPAETPSEAKKRKRREYQQKKRKQMQLSMKQAAESNLNPPKGKRLRKGSRYEEDYDNFIDNLMAQLRLLPPMQIQEPSLTTNFAVCPLFGSGDLTKLKNKDYDILKGDLVGEFGNAKIPNVADYYNTKPFGDEEPLPEKPPASTQRGFYDQEFQPIMFEEDPEEKKLDFICKERDTDTPDSIVSCSSPECLEIEPPNRFPGLKLIDDEEEEEDSDSAMSGKVSPIIPIIAPVPIRVKPVSLYNLKEEEDGQLVKTGDADLPMKKMMDSPGGESNENVTVTLTLTSGAAEDILGVLKELAGLLHIPPPTSYQIIERTATPPSHKLGLYRSKGKDGKEGTPIDIQSILNGAAKFCRHCDVVILDSVVRAKASEFPLLSANKGNAGEILCDSDSDLYFCSTQCYERFAWRPTNIILDGKSKSSGKEDIKSDGETNLSKDRDDFDTASTESMETDDLDIKPDIKDEKMDLSFMDGLDNDELMKQIGDDVALDDDLKAEPDQDEKPSQSPEKEKYKGIRYKAWSPGCIGPPVKYKRPTDRELTELVFRTGVAIMPVSNEDVRKCELCGIQGDGVADGVSRLLNCDVDRWVHLNCALWSEGVYETVSGALMNVETALANGSNATCAVCRRLGATVRCFKVRCGSVYHLGCAVKDNCVFYKNKTAFCASHAPKGEKDNELTTLSVQRRVYVSRDEQRQVASVMLHSDTNHLIRVGGLIFLSPGHLLPHQLAAFHTPNYIYPIGYKISWAPVAAPARGLPHAQLHLPHWLQDRECSFFIRIPTISSGPDLIFLSPGHLLPHQLAAFHTPNYIYPIGYKIVSIPSSSEHQPPHQGLIFLSPGHLLPHQLAAFHTPNYIYPIGYKISWAPVAAPARGLPHAQLHLPHWLQDRECSFFIRIPTISSGPDLIFLSPGHLLPHQLAAFHTPNYIYPIGYKISWAPVAAPARGLPHAQLHLPHWIQDRECSFFIRIPTISSGPDLIFLSPGHLLPHQLAAFHTPNYIYPIGYKILAAFHTPNYIYPIGYKIVSVPSSSEYQPSHQGLIFLSPGHLLPHQLAAFHTPNYIYPIGYKISWAPAAAPARSLPHAQLHLPHWVQDREYPSLSEYQPSHQGLIFLSPGHLLPHQLAAFHTPNYIYPIGYKINTNHLIRVGGLIFLSPGHLLPHQLAAFHTPNYIYPIGYKIVSIPSSSECQPPHQGLIFLSPGHLLPHQLADFHTPNYIYPIGYKIVRFYWSMTKANSRCRYLCWISEEEGKPRFHVKSQDEGKGETCAATPRAAWATVLDSVQALREGRNEEGVLALWSQYVTGEDLFGLTEPCVVRVLESLPGVETLTDYRFKFGRSALLEGGLAVNPSARDCVVRVLESLPGVETLTDYRFKFGRSALLEGGLAVNPSARDCVVRVLESLPGVETLTDYRFKFGRSALLEGGLAVNPSARDCVVRVLESLPGVETLTDYRFKFGRSALLEGGLAVNPSGNNPPRLPLQQAVRAHQVQPVQEDEARVAQQRVSSQVTTPPACPYSKQFVHTKSSQYKKMKLEWRNNVYLASKQFVHTKSSQYKKMKLEWRNNVYLASKQFVHTKSSQYKKMKLEWRNNVYLASKQFVHTKSSQYKKMKLEWRNNVYLASKQFVHTKSSQYKKMKLEWRNNVYLAR